MYSTISLIVVCLFIWFLWIKHRRSYIDLALYYLWITPFLALVSVINHNLDHDVMHPYFRMIPYILVTFFLLISFNSSLLRWKSRQFWCALLALSVYAFLSFLQFFNAIYPDWSVITWSWIVPGCILFFIAGYETSFNKLIRHHYAAWVILGFISIGLFLRFYALFTGMVEDIWLTRNMGSIYANGILIVLTYGGIAWLQIRNSLKFIMLLIFFVLVSIVFSMSRSGLLPLLMVAVLLFSEFHRNKFYRIFAILFISAASLLLIGMIVTKYSDNAIINGLLSGWVNRLQGIDVSMYDWMTTAVQARVDEFQDIYKSAFEKHVLTGVGFGQYHFASGSLYSDAHNMFITECYENGVLATMFLYVVFCIAVVYACLRLFSRNMIPLGISFLLCMILVHTGGTTLSERANPAQYFTPYPIWALFFIIGNLMFPLKNVRKLKELRCERHIGVSSSSIPEH